MTTKQSAVILGVIALALAAVLAYLRDPPWLSRVESGLRGWETSADGVRYRWTGGHASFFVPAGASAILVPARTTFAPGDPRVLVRIAIDDRAADEFVLSDDRWQTRRLAMPAPGSRHLRRVDIRVDRVREGYRGVQLGTVEIVP